MTIQTRTLALATAAMFIAMTAPAAAAPVVLTGDYMKTGISDYGTLGSNSSTSPGLLHDKTGTQNFGINDYITPGTPHEGFSLVSTQSGMMENDNRGVASFFGSGPTVLTGAAANGYANAATWTGANSYASITNSYFFNDGDERILVTTEITALKDLSNLAFARSVDPDPDVNTYGSYVTNNQRGNDVFGVNDFVGSAGQNSGLTLALVNLSGDTYVHGTQINGSCCTNINPYNVLSSPGAVSSTGDYGLNMAWSLGNLAAGSSATVRYAYAVGDNIATVGVPGGVSAVPEPATWAMMVLGFGGVGAAIRRRRRAPLLA